MHHDVDELLETVFHLSGCDFRQYAEASILRRVRRFLEKHALEDTREATRLVRDDPRLLADFLDTMTVQVSELFRDPSLFRLFRESVIPDLRSLHRLSFWVAGCSSGEEVLSLSIVLQEEGLERRSTIYATDLNEHALERARNRTYPIEGMKLSTQSYLRSGGKRSLSDYYVARYDQALFDRQLHSNVIFSRHNLASGASLREFTMIFCRNVMIYFDFSLKLRVLDLLHRSLVPLGYLALGDKEILRSPILSPRYSMVDSRIRIYRRDY